MPCDNIDVLEANEETAENEANAAENTLDAANDQLDDDTYEFAAHTAKAWGAALQFSRDVLSGEFIEAGKDAVDVGDALHEMSEDKEHIEDDSTSYNEAYERNQDAQDKLIDAESQLTDCCEDESYGVA